MRQRLIGDEDARVAVHSSWFGDVVLVMQTRSPRRLDPTILANPLTLGCVLDECARDDLRLQRHAREILGRQRRLQVLCDEPAWESYLHLEEQVNARSVELVQFVVAWAFEQGCLFERSQRSG